MNSFDTVLIQVECDAASCSPVGLQASSCAAMSTLYADTRLENAVR